MKIGIIAYMNNSYNQKQRVTFRAKGDETLRVVKNAIRITKGELPHPGKTQYRKTIKTLLKMVNNSPLVEQAKFEMRYGKMQGKATRLLKSEKADIQKKKDVIEMVFMLKDDESKKHSKMFSNYIWKKMIPQIQQTKNKELADHILTLTKVGANETDTAKIYERFRFITQLGDKSYIEEVEQLKAAANLKYSDKPSNNLLEYMYNSEANDTNRFIKRGINQNANKTIEKLQTNPNF